MPASTPTTGSRNRPIRDHKTFKDGDFTLISEDGWRFRVQSQLLFAMRYVGCGWEQTVQA